MIQDEQTLALIGQNRPRSGQLLIELLFSLSLQAGLKNKEEDMTGLGFLFFLIAGVEGQSILKEDLNAIRKVQIEQRATEVAQQLELTQEQVTQLKSIRRSVDQVKDERGQRRRSLEQKYAPVVKAIRASYESGSTPDAGQLAQLKELRREKRMVQREFHLKMGLATLGLADVLTRDQMAMVAKKGSKHKKGKGVHQGDKHRKRRFARFVLSDAFLSAL